MSDLARISVSIPNALLERLEQMARQSQYDNRSEFVRDMIRERLVENQWDADGEAVGTITIIYNHHTRGLTEKLVKLQHMHHGAILAGTHVHMDHHLCAEMILAKGPAGEIREVHGLIRQQKGVLHAALSMSSTGKDLA